MAQILVRKLDEAVKRRLKSRAAAHGRSLEAEARAILSEAVEKTPKIGLGTLIASRFAGLGLEEGDIEEFRGEEPRPADFSD